MTRSYYRGAAGALVVYDKTNRETRAHRLLEPLTATRLTHHASQSETPSPLDYFICTTLYIDGYFDWRWAFMIV